MKKLLNFSLLKFKDRDDLVDIFKSWDRKAPFNMLELRLVFDLLGSLKNNRDQRLRYHYKERYDFRENMCDWDYQMGLKEDVLFVY